VRIDHGTRTLGWSRRRIEAFLARRQPPTGRGESRPRRSDTSSRATPAPARISDLNDPCCRYGSFVGVPSARQQGIDHAHHAEQARLQEDEPERVRDLVEAASHSGDRRTAMARICWPTPSRRIWTLRARTRPGERRQRARTPGGLGSSFRRGAGWWTAYYVKGPSDPDSVAKRPGQPPEETIPRRCGALPPRRGTPADGTPHTGGRAGLFPGLGSGPGPATRRGLSCALAMSPGSPIWYCLNIAVLWPVRSMATFSLSSALSDLSHSFQKRHLAGAQMR
jgi:hypothetical protein